MSALYNKAKEYIATIGDHKTREGMEAIAAHFKVGTKAAEMWWKKKQFPQRVYERMYDDAMAQQEAHEASSPPPIDPNNPPVEVESETFETIGARVQHDPDPAIDQETGRSFYEPEPEQIHPTPSEDRLDRLERLVLGLAEQLQAPAVGARIPHSEVRPIAGATDAQRRAGIINPGLPKGTGTGRAPTREEANSSAGGTLGRPAGPATQRRQIKPGDPGWNGRSAPDRRDGWNDPKPKPQMVAMWPASR